MNALESEIRWLWGHGLKMAERYKLGGVPGAYDRVILYRCDPDPVYAAKAGYVNANPRTHTEDFCSQIAGYEFSPKLAYYKMWHNWRAKRYTERLERLEALQDEILELSDCE